MAELDAETVKQIGQLIGEMKGLHSRFDSLDAKVDLTRTSLDDRLTRHEEREEPRLNKIERLTWIGVGGVIVIASAIPIGLTVIIYMMP